MPNEASSKTAERLAIVIFLLFLTGMGWLNLLGDGISIKGKNGHVSFISGNFGLAIACGTFLLAVLPALLLSRSLNFSRRSKIILMSLIILPPLLFLLW